MTKTAVRTLNQELFTCSGEFGDKKDSERIAEEMRTAPSIYRANVDAARVREIRDGINLGANNGQDLKSYRFVCERIIKNAILIESANIEGESDWKRAATVLARL